MTTDAKNTEKLKRDLSLFGLTMIAIGSCIGSGIFLTPSQVASHLPRPGLILLAWALGGLIALTGALTLPVSCMAGPISPSSTPAPSQRW